METPLPSAGCMEASSSTAPATPDVVVAAPSAAEPTPLPLPRVEEDAPPVSSSTAGLRSAGKLGAFSLQLVEEFLARYELHETAAVLQRELQRQSVARPGAQLWFEMQHSCRAALARGRRGSCNASSTLEKLLAFCVAFGAPRTAAASLALDVTAISSPVTVYCSSPQPGSVSKLKQSAFSLRQAQHQLLSPVVRPSRRRGNLQQQQQQQRSSSLSALPAAPSPTTSSPSRQEPETDGEPPATAAPSSGPAQMDSESLQEPAPDTKSAAARPLSSSATTGRGGEPQSGQQLALSPGKRHKPRKKKRSHAASAASNNNASASQPAPTARRGLETSLVSAHDAQVKRDLHCGRLLAREMRQLRVERVKCESVRRGAASLEAALARDDPYAKELVRERYGFIQRVECALCAFAFLPVNLPHRVSFKCIMDLHAQWGYAPPHRELAARYRPPLCYDAVRVCRMCAPIVFQRTTALPSSYDGRQANDVPSAAMQRTKSLDALAAAKAKNRAEEGTEKRLGCSDPYALPPLFGDDVIEDGHGYLGGEWSVEDARLGCYFAGAGGAAGPGESSAKAIVYAHQTDAAAFMSSKEWEVINPHRSSIRQVMEDSLRGT